MQMFINWQMDKTVEQTIDIDYNLGESRVLC